MNVEGPKTYPDEVSYENFKKSAPFPNENFGENWLCLFDRENYQTISWMILEKGPKIQTKIPTKMFLIWRKN